MATRSYRADALAIAQQWVISPPDDPATGPLEVTINGKTVSVPEWNPQAIANKFGRPSATDPATQAPEFTELRAVVEGTAPSQRVVVSAATPGRPFWLATTIGGLPLANSRQVLTFAPVPSGGTFTLTHRGPVASPISPETTGNISAPATAAGIETALAALAGIGSGNVRVTQPVANVAEFVVEFVGTLAQQWITLLTAATANLTGGTASVRIRQLQDYRPTANEVQTLQPVLNLTGGTFRIRHDGVWSGNIAWDANATALQTVLTASWGTGITAGGGPFPGTPLTLTFGSQYAASNQPLVEVDTTNLTTSAGTLGVSVIAQGSATGAVNEVRALPSKATLDGLLPSTAEIRLEWADNVSSAVTLASYGPTSVATALAATLRWPRPNFNTLEDWGAWDQSATIGSEQLSVTTGNHRVTAGGISLNVPSVLVEFRESLGAFPLQSRGLRLRLQTRDTPTSPWVSYSGGADLPIWVDPATNQARTGRVGTTEVLELVSGAGPNPVEFGLSLGGVVAGPFVTATVTSADLAVGLSAAWNDGLQTVRNLQVTTVGGGSGPLSTGPLRISGLVGSRLHSRDLGAVTIVNASGGAVRVVETQAGDPGALETQAVVLDGNPWGGTVTLNVDGTDTSALSYNASAATVATAVAVVAGSTTGSGGPWPAEITLRFGVGAGNLPPLTATHTLRNAALAIAARSRGGIGLPVSERRRSAGPNHWDDPLNWITDSGPVGSGATGVPESGDVIRIEQGRGQLLYGLRHRSRFTVDTTTDRLTFLEPQTAFRDGQAVRVSSTGTLPAPLAAGTTYYVVNRTPWSCQLSTTRGGGAVNLTNAGSGVHTVRVKLDSLTTHNRWSGRLGLPQRGAAGEREYRPTHLELDAPAVTLGAGEGTGSPLLRIDSGPSETTTVTVLATSGSAESGFPSLHWLGTAAGNLLRVVDGSVGVALVAESVATLASLTQRAGDVELGPGVTVGPIEKTGGTLRSEGASVNGSVTIK
jgi:hypothetical protein